MRLVAAGLIYVAVSCVAALILGMTSGGLNEAISAISLMLGAIAGVAAFTSTPPPDSATRKPIDVTRTVGRYRNLWLWLVGAIFAMFALRSFCWLLFYDGEVMRIQSPHNLGDLGLHIAYIKNFANGVKLWPDSPLYVFSKLRYPAGMDLFNGLLTELGFDLRHQLAAAGLLASIATFYAFYRWSGTFGIAGFLFNGGLAGYQFFRTWQFIGYQDGPNISWKSIPLTMFVTQRGLLYAIPAGLVLLWQWRRKYGSAGESGRRVLPGWVEYILYATMPLFHIHTFLALNFVLALLFLGRPQSRIVLIRLVAAALLPATFFVWLITDNFHAKSVFEWHLGWTQNVDEFAMPFLSFWLVNFGVFLPFAIVLLIIVMRKDWTNRRDVDAKLSGDAIFLAAAALIFLFACLIKTAPWEWDNIKIIIWAYFLTLPILWNRLIKPWPLAARVAACIVLFLSGFVNLFGGLAAGRAGFEFASRIETDVIASAIRNLPVEARFAAYPTYNHPLLLNGRKVVCGYTGHLWTQGIDYAPVEEKLRSLMLGENNWMELGRELHVRYLFWGNDEKANYATSRRPWEGQLPIAVQGSWGAIYDFGSYR
ncbi:MAG TPA: hypothetical protein VGH08_11670 [Chthoniobacterales bacterium]